MENTLLGKYMVMVKDLQCAKLKDKFALFDKHNTGFIKCEDVGKVMRPIGKNPTDEELKDAINVLDVDKNGVVGFSEFLNFMASMLRDDDPEEHLKYAFKVFDKDQDGFITAEELSNALSCNGEVVTEEAAKSMVKMVDFDDDGKLSYEDFKKMMLSKCDST